MKKIMTVVLGALFACQAMPITAQQPGTMMGNQAMASGQINWIANYQDAVRQAQATSKPILILFTGTGWCPACMKLEREVLKNPQFAQAVGDKFIFVRADFGPGGMGNSPNSSLLSRYNVDSFPTMIVVDANGQRLFNIDYKMGGPEAYIRDINQKLGSRGGAGSNSYYTPSY